MTLVFLGFTFIVELLINWIYPRLILKCSSKTQILQQQSVHNYNILNGPIRQEFSGQGYDSIKEILVEEKLSGDLDGNAALMFDTVVLGKSLMRQHKDNVDEVLAILLQMLAHKKYKHVF